MIKITIKSYPIDQKNKHIKKGDASPSTDPGPKHIILCPAAAPARKGIVYPHNGGLYTSIGVLRVIHRRVGRVRPLRPCRTDIQGLHRHFSDAGIRCNPIHIDILRLGSGDNGGRGCGRLSGEVSGLWGGTACRGGVCIYSIPVRVFTLIVVG